MAVYTLHDILTDDAGEIQLENGDLAIASVKRSHLQALNFIVMSNRPDMVSPDAASNLGVFQGALNLPPTHRMMETYVRRAVVFQQLFDPKDIAISVTPVDVDAVALTIRTLGSYVEDLARDQDPTVGWQVLGYFYPFDDAYPQKIS